MVSYKQLAPGIKGDLFSEISPLKLAAILITKFHGFSELPTPGIPTQYNTYHGLMKQHITCEQHDENRMEC